MKADMSTECMGEVGSLLVISKAALKLPVWPWGSKLRATMTVSFGWRSAGTSPKVNRPDAGPVILVLETVRTFLSSESKCNQANK